VHFRHLQDNGKPIFFSRAADVPLSFDHLRYFAG
jgi:aldehyde dehydrogenase (NAD+)